MSYLHTHGASEEFTGTLRPHSRGYAHKLAELGMPDNMNSPLRNCRAHERSSSPPPRTGEPPFFKSRVVSCVYYHLLGSAGSPSFLVPGPLFSAQLVPGPWAAVAESPAVGQHLHPTGTSPRLSTVGQTCLPYQPHANMYMYIHIKAFDFCAFVFLLASSTSHVPSGLSYGLCVSVFRLALSTSQVSPYIDFAIPIIVQHSLRPGIDKSFRLSNCLSLIDDA